MIQLYNYYSMKNSNLNFENIYPILITNKNEEVSGVHLLEFLLACERELCWFFP